MQRFLIKFLNIIFFITFQAAEWTRDQAVNSKQSTNTMGATAVSPIDTEIRRNHSKLVPRLQRQNESCCHSFEVAATF